MAKPIAFKPITVDFKADLVRRLEKAPDEHAAALLAAYNVLEAAYDEGLLDILHGMIASKDKIISTLAQFAAEPGGITGIRNLLTAAKILTELDPEVLDHVSKAMAQRHGRAQARTKAAESLSACQTRHQRRQPPRALVHDDGSRQPGQIAEALVCMSQQLRSAGRGKQVACALRQLRMGQRMGTPEQLFQFPAAEDIPMLQCDPVDTRPIRCRDNTLSLQKLTKPLWARGERQHSSSILREINLRKHLPAIGLRADPEDEFVAPLTGLTASLDNVG